MSDVLMNTIGVVLIFVLILFFCNLADKNGYEAGYKNGQIDAAYGLNNYVLIEFKNGTRGWYKHSELKDLVDYTVIEHPILP